MRTQLDFVVAVRFVLTSLIAMAAAIGSAANASAANRQWVEGFAEVEFHHDANGSTPTRDFRGPSRGYMTAGWWAPGEMKKNYVSWKTATVPAKKETTFVFIGATSVLPSDFSRGPTAKLSVNGKEALEFTIGVNQDRVWKQGDYELKYISKRVEYPYFGSHRELRELNGNSGIFQLTVPASAVEANQPATLKVEVIAVCPMESRLVHGQGAPRRVGKVDRNARGRSRIVTAGCGGPERTNAHACHAAVRRPVRQPIASSTR